ncbi:MAG: hypothetical protein JO260_09095 [Acidobacteria bacterium]|nr:hypothetical protein [Acidobacteriota bacterium]
MKCDPHFAGNDVNDSSVDPWPSSGWSASRYLDNLRKAPFGCLLSLFLNRMFQGNSESSSDDFNLNIGVVLSLLATPGLFISLLMFEKYGSLMRFARQDFSFDPYVAAIPDEYFFLVLSIVITGAATLWRWDAIFLDRRDHANLVPLPVPLKTLFAANFCAVFILAATFAVVVNAASIVLFPLVVGGTRSFAALLRFAAGHGLAIVLASVFSFFFVFAVAGVLMSVLPAQLFRRASLLIRFLLIVVLLCLLATVFAIPKLLEHSNPSAPNLTVVLPPVSFLGVSRAIWGRANEPFVMRMAVSSLLALATAIAAAVLAYALSFRRAFLRISETADSGPLPRLHFSLPNFSLFTDRLLLLRSPSQRACFHFAIKTLLRSEVHLQSILAFTAVGLVCAAESLNSPQVLKSLAGPHPSVGFLAIPFILSYTLIVGIRFAFEMPADLRANWIFRMWIPAELQDARPIARSVAHALTTSWLVPATVATTLRFSNPTDAVIHTAILLAANAVLVEVLLANFRKIPFTCSYPAFESHSGVILVAYLFGFFIFTDYLPRLEQWMLIDPIRCLLLVPLLAAPLVAIHIYRMQLLPIDKQLMFDESASAQLLK